MISFMAPSSSSKSSLSPHLSPHFTPIQEGNEEEEEEEFQESSSFRETTPSTDCTDKREVGYKHYPTPLHKGSVNREKSSGKRRPETDGVARDDRGVSCNKCRPNAREKTSVVPLDSNGINWRSIASPNELFRSIFSSLVKKSPKSSDGSLMMGREEQWKIAVAELTHKLVQATRKRDEAVLEVSRLKYSMSELEKKLNKLEMYCQNLKSGLDVCSGNSLHQINKTNTRMSYQNITVGDQEKVIEHFLVRVSEARSSVRLLSRSLTVHLQQIGGKAYERISLLLQPYDIKISMSRNPRGLVFYLEALLNRAFFDDFESIGFQKGGPNQILNPIDRCEANFAWFNRLQGLTWEEVLNRGTRHFSEEFSKFCDRKMNEIVAMLGWNRAWPEPLLQAFFVACKAVWLVHLLANSLHPSLPIFRVDKGVGFDLVYMEDMGAARAHRLVPAMVRIMVTPGFYVYDNVVKCKVLCRYQNSSGNNSSFGDEKALTPSSPTCVGYD